MTCEQCYVCEQIVLQCSRTMLLAMTYDLCHGGHMVAEYPLLHTPPQGSPFCCMVDLCVRLALLLCGVTQRWQGGFHCNVHAVRTLCTRSAKTWRPKGCDARLQSSNGKFDSTSPRIVCAIRCHCRVHCLRNSGGGCRVAPIGIFCGDFGGALCALCQSKAILDPFSPMAKVTQYLLCCHAHDC